MVEKQVHPESRAGLLFCAVAPPIRSGWADNRVMGLIIIPAAGMNALSIDHAWGVGS